MARFNQPSQSSSRCPRLSCLFMSDIPSTREAFIRAHASERLGWLSAWARAINICEAQRVYSGVVRGFLNSGALILAHASQRLGWLSAWRVSINRRRVHRVVRGSCPTFPQLGKHLFGRIHRSASGGCQRGHVSINHRRVHRVSSGSCPTFPQLGKHLFGCTHRSASGGASMGTGNQHSQGASRIILGIPLRPADPEACMRAHESRDDNDFRR